MEYLGTDVLPVHRLRIIGAGELEEILQSTVAAARKATSSS
jgi:hypothetical protein